MENLTGTRIDAARLDYELGRRGLGQTQFSKLAGISQPQLSRMRHGKPVRPATLRRLADALLRTSPVPGFDLFLSEPQSKVQKGRARV